MKKYCLFIFSLLIVSTSFGWDRRLPVYPGHNMYGQQICGPLQGKALTDAMIDACNEALGLCGSRERDAGYDSICEITTPAHVVSVTQISDEVCNVIDGAPIYYFDTFITCEAKARPK